MKRLLIVFSFTVVSVIAFTQTKVKTVTVDRYKNCIELNNGYCKVVLEPNIGGRVLEYSVNGKNIFFNNPGEDTLKQKPAFIYPSGGRLDIGPERTTPKRPNLFMGPWKSEISGNKSGKMISQPDTATGVIISREFSLADTGSVVTCRHTIKNISNSTKHYCFWQRTFCLGNGISITPIDKFSRLPKSFVMMSPSKIMYFDPEPEPNIRIHEGVLEVIGEPSKPKFLIDGSDDWMAYLSTNNLLFLINYPIDPKVEYPEIAPSTASIWYYKDIVCEMEPMSPLYTIEPGKEVSYTITWKLVPYKFPADRKANLSEIKKLGKTIK